MRHPVPTFRDMRVWDVRGLDGDLVTSLDGLRQTLGMSYDVAVQWVRGREHERAMPSELIAEAHRNP